MPFDQTLEGKLPQRKIAQTAAAGYSSYGNQIGLATGHVAEVYHPGYIAKHLEVGAVVGAAPGGQRPPGAARAGGCGDSPGRPHRAGTASAAPPAPPRATT